MQIIRNRKVFDVCIIGSGAGGGMAAKVLTEAGADVVMLEAGPMWDPVGLGLGLAFSRSGVEADGGQLRVRSLPAKGCVFTISLPIASVPTSKN